MNETIMGGAFLLARQIFTSKIWQDKPSSWKIIWIYILGQVNHTDNSKFKRGEGYFNFVREIKDIGCDITYDMIRHAIQFFKGESMISTSRSTRGMTIKVLNYDKYQTLDNYQSTSSSTSKAQEKHKESTPINKNDKNDKNDKNERSIFTPPLLEEIKKYCLERKNTVNPERFINFYESKGWLIGKTKMKDWRAAVRTWENSEFNKPKNKLSI